MFADASLTVLSAVTNAVFLGAGVYIYLSLARQVSARVPEVSEVPLKTFGLPEILLALVLAGWFSINIAAAANRTMAGMRTRELVLNAAFSIGLLLVVVTFLRFRRLEIERLAGFSKIGFLRAFSTGTVLMLAAYPLIFLADLLTQKLAGGTKSDRQEIVELFNASTSLDQRVAIIVLAVAIAPLVEEFLFRFFFYGVLKRYFGRGTGLVANALMFAAVHTHLPSFLPLFILGSCLTLAYEWSGSILVSMTMHALFNGLTLIALAFPDFIQQ